MTTTEGHDMSEPMTDRELAQIRGYLDNTEEYGPRSVGNHNMLTRLLAEVDRLRAELDDAKRLADYYHEDRDATAGFWEDSQAEVNRLQDELKAAKSTRFENNGVGDVAKHIQAETINDLRLN
jgi:ABC-type transporter Mla subunit MlaD